MFRGRSWGVAVVVLVVATAGGYLVYAVTRDNGTAAPPGCRVSLDNRTYTLSPEQTSHATTIAAVGKRMGMPDHAVSVALAAALQESKLQNLQSGDRDSLGLFQQRPSQGWGTAEEILDPVYSINAFYDALEQVDGFEDMEITEAAQRVQHSAYPSAYADHEEDARALASALTGYSPATFSCDLDGGAPSADEDLLDSGLTARADAVREDLLTRYGDLDLGGFAPGGVTTGHMEGSAHYEGRAIDVFFRPVNDANKTRGWAVAHYLVGNAARLDIRTVIFDDRIWTAGRDGWRDYDPPESSGSRVVLEHRDHVHVDVFG